ncbi:MAG TPA: hypothetical protein VHT04_04560 [Stellaceae bacterium]|nr:hypothetical protein [Stellaceae bacterium]
MVAAKRCIIASIVWAGGRSADPRPDGDWDTPGRRGGPVTPFIRAVAILCHRAAGRDRHCTRRGVTPNSCVRSGPGTVGLPIIVGGVAIESGDIVVGDRDVVVVPRARLDAVLTKLETVRKAEAALEAKVAGGLAVPSWIEELLGSDRVHWQ